MATTRGELLNELIEDGYLKTPSLIDAFQKIDRADFVLDEYKAQAYKNYPLPIGEGQTISQPLTVAFMLTLLEPKVGEKILDVGSGSGWQTALLAHIVGEKGKIIGIERIHTLKTMAEERLKKYGFIERGIVKSIEGDGSCGYESEAPFDKIIAAAAGDAIPEAWKKQLKIGGRIVAPIRSSIYVLDKIENDAFEERRYFGFNFVPLITG